MKKNKLIIDEFKKLIQQIKFDIDNSKDKKEKTVNMFRMRSILNVIKIIENYDKEIKDAQQLKNIKGIGKGTIDRINEILKKGKLHEIKKEIIEKSYEKYIDELEKIYGIGRDTALQLFKNYNIKSIKELKKLYKDKKIDLNENIVKGLKYYGKIKDKIPRIEIDQINNLLLPNLYSIDKLLYGIICGSYRRLKMFSNDIDFLIVHPKLKTKDDIENSKINYLSLFINKLYDIGFMIDGFTATDVRTKFMGICQINKNIYRRIDIRFIPYQSYYYAVFYFTGSGEFNRNIRMHAKNLGFTLNEYGLYDKNNKFYPAKSENDIFKYLGLEYISPQNRK